MINICFSKGIFFEKLRKYKSIPKKKFDVENICSIASIPAFIKIVVTSINKQILHYFESNECFHKNQYGFRLKTIKI